MYSGPAKKNPRKFAGISCQNGPWQIPGRQYSQPSISTPLHKGKISPGYHCACPCFKGTANNLPSPQCGYFALQPEVHRTQDLRSFALSRPSVPPRPPFVVPLSGVVPQYRKHTYTSGFFTSKKSGRKAVVPESPVLHWLPGKRAVQSAHSDKTSPALSAQSGEGCRYHVAPVFRNLSRPGSVRRFHASF